MLTVLCSSSRCYGRSGDHSIGLFSSDSGGDGVEVGSVAADLFTSSILNLTHADSAQTPPPNTSRPAAIGLHFLLLGFMALLKRYLVVALPLSPLSFLSRRYPSSLVAVLPLSSLPFLSRRCPFSRRCPPSLAAALLLSSLPPSLVVALPNSSLLRNLLTYFQ